MALADYLYHVTFFKYLRGIAHRGLNPLSNGKGMATGSNNPLCLRCEGRTFLTEEAGIKFWYGCLEAWAFHESDDPLAEGFTPVVLRISDDDVPEAHIDEEGSNDARAEAWYVTSRIHHETIEVWTGPDGHASRTSTSKTGTRIWMRSSLRFKTPTTTGFLSSTPTTR